MHWKDYFGALEKAVLAQLKQLTVAFITEFFLSRQSELHKQNARKLTIKRSHHCKNKITTTIVHKTIFPARIMVTMIY